MLAALEVFSPKGSAQVTFSAGHAGRFHAASVPVAAYLWSQDLSSYGMLV